MEIETNQIDDDITVLALTGRLNMAAAPALKTTIDDVLGAGAARLVVDLSGVSFLDSSGLGTLITGLKKTRERHGDLRLAGANGQVLTVLRLTNLDRVLRPHASIEEATDGW